MFTLWLPPKVWRHGSQSTITGRSTARNGHACRIICWFAASIRWVFSTPFGVPVDPEVNRIFAIPSGSQAAERRRHRRPWLGGQQGGQPAPRPGRSPLRTIAGHVPGIASSAGANASASSANTAPGRISSAIARIRAWSRLCSEYATLTGRDRNPGGHRAQRHQQVVHAVARTGSAAAGRGRGPGPAAPWPIASAAATASA